jgi:subtilase family serine protease
MPNTKLAVISIFILLTLLASSATLATISFSAGNSSYSNLTSKATVNYNALFYSSTLPNPQPSPYCNVGTAKKPFVIMCYTPEDLKVAYNFPSNLNGRGQTIVIIDAFGSPSVQSDLNAFDKVFGLPFTSIQIVCQGGSCPKFNPHDSDMIGWAGEIALDTQYAHAMAPGARIVLFVAKSDDDLTLEQAAQSAVQMFPHSIISQSFGDPELDMLQHTCFLTTNTPTGHCTQSYVEQTLAVGEAAYMQAAKEGTTVFASAGDWGADNYAICVQYPVFPKCGFTSENPVYPSSSPWVTAVGGTMGMPYFLNSIPSCTAKTCSTGLVNFLDSPSCHLDTKTPAPTSACTPVGYGNEKVWNEPAFDAATGGAPSLLFNAPSYQSSLGLSMRTTPDVSYNAAVDGGVFVYYSAGGTQPGAFYIFGGTSAGSPQWAAVAALADQYATMHSLGTIGFINPDLYQIGNNPTLYNRDFHDIKAGNNIVVGSPHHVGFYAHAGWDDASGLGTPNVANLIPDLVTLSATNNTNQ